MLESKVNNNVAEGSYIGTDFTDTAASGATSSTLSALDVDACVGHANCTSCGDTNIHIDSGVSGHHIDPI